MIGTACRRRTFLVNHNTLAEVNQREDLLRRRDNGTLSLSDRITLLGLMKRAINPPPEPTDAA